MEARRGLWLRQGSSLREGVAGRHGAAPRWASLPPPRDLALGVAPGRGRPATHANHRIVGTVTWRHAARWTGSRGHHSRRSAQHSSRGGAQRVCSRRAVLPRRAPAAPAPGAPAQPSTAVRNRTLLLGLS